MEIAVGVMVLLTEKSDSDLEKRREDFFRRIEVLLINSNTRGADFIRDLRLTCSCSFHAALSELGEKILL